MSVSIPNTQGESLPLTVGEAWLVMSLRADPPKDAADLLKRWEFARDASAAEPARESAAFSLHYKSPLAEEAKKPFDPDQPVSDPECLDFAEVAALRIIARMAEVQAFERAALLEDNNLIWTMADISREIRRAVCAADRVLLNRMLHRL